MSDISSAPSTSTGGRSGWIVSPAADLLLGCGLGYVALVLLLWLLRPDMSRITPWLPLVILLTGVPHYGATLLRTYGTAESRRRYARHAFLLSAPLLPLFLLGLSLPRLGCVLITLYLSLSPWHYAAQNYGLALLFLRRRGVAVGEIARRLLRASFITSYGLVLLSYHHHAGAGAAGGSDPLYAASAAYRFSPLPVPEGLLHVAVPLLLLCHAGCLAAGLLLLRRGRPARLGPALALLGTQAVWFTVPALASLLWPGSYPGSRAPLAFIWVAVGHCVQYLWISLHHARCSGAAGSSLSVTGYLGKVTLLGAALWTVPALCFSPGAGAGSLHLPFDLGLGLLIAAVVNLHHFLLDGAVWKLRDPRVGQVLLRHAPAGPQAIPSFRPSAGWATLVAVGGLSVLCWVGATWEREVGYRRAYARGDVTRLQLAASRLAAMGRDGPQIHMALGRLWARAGRTDEAEEEYRRAYDLRPKFSP